MTDEHQNYTLRRTQKKLPRFEVGDRVAIRKEYSESRPFLGVGTVESVYGTDIEVKFEDGANVKNISMACKDNILRLDSALPFNPVPPEHKSARYLALMLIRNQLFKQEP